MATASDEFLVEVQVLAGQRRNDDARGLRNDDEAQHLAVGEADGAGRLLLALGHAQDAGAHDLGDEAGGVDRQPQQQRHELGLDHHAALEIEAA